ncbi:MAG: hypothetical protein ABR543_03780 [Gemmatimonadaceae bacterium]
MTRRPWCLIITFASGLVASQLGAQFVANSAGTGAQASSIASDFRVNFAVPDAPAFSLIDVEPSKILRPQSVRELAVAFSGFQSEGHSFRVPNSFAVEFSPGLLIGGEHLKLADYKPNRWLYRARISAATKHDTVTDAPTLIALGLRTTVIDEADPRWHSAEVLIVTNMTDSINAIYVNARRRLGVRTPEGDIIPLTLTADEQAQVDALNARIKRRWEALKWNAEQLEFAAGAGARAADPSGQSLRAIEYAVWGTYATGLGTTWAHWLLGVKASSARDTSLEEFKSSGTVSSRLYIGTNRYKAFVEGQVAGRQERRPEWLCNSGIELYVAPSIWANFTAALEKSDPTRKSRLVTRFKLKTGLPRV